MGNSSSHSLPQDQIQNIVDNTNFNSKQVVRLYERFQRLDKDETGYLTKEDFLKIPELAINPLADRIIDMFLIQPKNSNDQQQMTNHSTTQDRVNFFEFCSMLSNFKTKFNSGNTDAEEQSKTAKLNFLFKMYDHDNDGFIKTEELLRLLRLMVGHNISHQQLQLIAERTIAETDKDNDGGLDFTEFCEGLKSVDIDGKMTVRFAE
jgi:calcineurin B family protein 1